MKYLPVIYVIAVLIVGSCNQKTIEQTPVKEFPNITVADVQKKIKVKNNILLLDVRTVTEFDGPLSHIAGAVLLPIQELEQRVDELNEHKEKEIIVICRSGNRSQTGTRILISHGFNAVNMLGGMEAWNAVQ
ncbi:MAG TPA: rhodanese-like domain-containing protein [Candidatus Marinimicrobia bacterium]|jgi:rhodanese-related sulfurtransferase|nr:rhodanese-like domain-containing protein [Candidatus Neomarinimicrobiota bacterium]